MEKHYLMNEKDNQSYKPRQKGCTRLLFLFLGVFIGICAVVFILQVLVFYKIYYYKNIQNSIFGISDDQKSYTNKGVHSALRSKRSTNCPHIVTRKEWGARTARRKIDMPSRPATYAIVHHVGSNKSACTTRAQCIDNVRTIQNIHMDHPRNRFDDIGYTYLIGSDGNVYEGTAWNVVGSHTKYYNTQGYGFCVIGDYSSNQNSPSPVALEKLQAIIDCGVAENWLDSNYILKGHRDVRPTECPGQNLYRIIRNWSHYRR